MKNFSLPRLDKHPALLGSLRKYSRIKPGEIWVDPLGRHLVGCLDAAALSDVKKLMSGKKATLAIQDPPYNIVAFEVREISAFIDWCRQWVESTDFALSLAGSLYVWLGADQKKGFQPLPEFLLMMRNTPFASRSFISLRNQRGFGTQKNWMAVRQELLYYVKGHPVFNIEAEYTDIPKILRGYYKEIKGLLTENLERSHSDNIRAGNVWVDVQQVFYRMEENVNGCYAQKPLKAIDRIIRASSNPGDLIVDFFCHSGTTLLAAEYLGRNCYTIDVEPTYCEVAIRRLELFRKTGKKGWQNSNPFEKEICGDNELAALAGLSRQRKESQLSLV